VSDVTLDIAEGALVSVVSPSGCGKTTLLKILADLHPADDGGVQIGNPTSHFVPGRDVGMVFHNQQPLLLKWRRILDNVMLLAEILHIPRAQARERAQYLLALVGLAGSGGRYP
jgi:NitT/TauT family transport system ATP-binding protein